MKYPMSIALATAVLWSCAPEDTPVSEYSFPWQERSYTTQGVWAFETDGTNSIVNGGEWNLTNVEIGNGVLTMDGIYEFTGPDVEGEERAVVEETTMDRDLFTLAIKFKPGTDSHNRPIIVGGTSYRWLITERDDAGVYVAFNNWRQDYVYETTFNNGWNTLYVAVDIDSGQAAIQLNRSEPEVLTLPSDFEWEFEKNLESDRDRELSLENYSNGTAFQGEVDWIIWTNGIALPDTIDQIAKDYGN